jgi:putative membrane protein
VTIRWLLAALHLLALAIGMESVWARGRALRRPLDADGLKRVFTHDNWYGIAALLWYPTGIARAFFGFEKGTGYYLHQPFFVAKLALVIIVGAVEMWVMVVLIRWRRQQQRGEAIDTRHAALMSRISAWETFAIMLIIFLATAVARNVRFS